MDLSSQTDENIAERVQNGDKEAFGVLVERYLPKMTRYAKKFLFDQNDATDVVQEVFIKVYVNIKSFDKSRSFSPWIYRITHNEFINVIKKKKHEPISFFDTDTLFPHPIAKEMADDESTRREMKELLDRSLEKIDPKYREVLILYYLENQSYQAIAEILHIPTSTVGVRLNRGKERLRKSINENNK